MPEMGQRVQAHVPQYEEASTRDATHEGEWQSFRTNEDRSLEPAGVFPECSPERRKLAVKMVDVLGNDTMTIVEVRV